MTDCLFCKIAAGDIPADKVYEDERVFVFLDIMPRTRGHMLVIPKKHAKNIFDIPEDVMRHVAVTAKKMAKAAKSALKCDGVNLIQSNGHAAQQEVMHFHLHVIPRYVGDNYSVWIKSSYEKEPLGLIAEKLKSVL